MKAKFIKVFDDNNGSWEVINTRDVVLIVVRGYKAHEEGCTSCEVEAIDESVFFHDVNIYMLNKRDEVILHNYRTMKSNYAKTSDDNFNSFITMFEENEELCSEFLIARESEGLGLFYIKKSEINIISGLDRISSNGDLYFESTIETTLMGHKLGDKASISEIDTDFLEYPIFSSLSPDELIGQLESSS